MKKKRCSRCKREKSLRAFNKSRRHSMKRHSQCRKCQKACRKEHYLLNRRKALSARQEYRREHREEIAAHRRGYIAANREAYNAQRRKKMRNNADYRIRANLRRRIHSALKGVAKSVRTLELLGCTIEQLKMHLESKFQSGMTWENYGYDGWHVDHVKPCAKFDLTDLKQQAECFHYTNLQPLWKKDNLEKSYL